MFGKLPELFDRDFAIGYFLPTATFMVASLTLINRFGLLPKILDINTASQVDVLVGTTIIGLVSWLVSVFLLATNRDILRFMEGYGRLNPVRLFGAIEKRRYQKLQAAKSKLDNECLSCSSEKQQLPKNLRLERIKLYQEAAEKFPDEEDWLLPTSFGNAIRAFEVYPRVMYGLDSIPGWSRLLGVIPEEYRSLVDSAKAQLDFWVNLWLLSLAVSVEYIGLAVYTHQARVLWFPLVAFSVVLIASSRATSSAIEWGELVKSSFDVFLPELREKLGFPSPATMDKERSLWQRFSQSILYRSAGFETNQVEQQAAWSLYVELTTRTAIQSLETQAGLLREALDSLHSLLELTREIMREAGPAVAHGPNSFGPVAIEVLNKGLRPFISKWHPLLDAHEKKRPPEASPLEHERNWEHYQEVHQELVALQKQIKAYADVLAEIAGTK